MQNENLTPDIRVTHIGDIPMGSDGRDYYLMLTRLDDDLSEDDAHNWLLERYYRDTNTPGGYFCHRVTIVPMPHSDNECIGIVHQRFDN